MKLLVIISINDTFYIYKQVKIKDLIENKEKLQKDITEHLRRCKDALDGRLK